MSKPTPQSQTPRSSRASRSRRNARLWQAALVLSVAGFVGWGYLRPDPNAGGGAHPGGEPGSVQAGVAAGGNPAPGTASRAMTATATNPSVPMGAASPGAEGLPGAPSKPVALPASLAQAAPTSASLSTSAAPASASAASQAGGSLAGGAGSPPGAGASGSGFARTDRAPAFDAGATLQVGAGIDPNRGRVRGVVKASEEVLFSSRLAARIARMPYKDGERFRRGDVLVGFDCGQLQAESRAAHAATRANDEVLRQHVELDAHGAIGRSEVEVSRARSDQTRAEAQALDSQLRDCAIVAPFSGLVVENLARRHEMAAPGKEVLRVINDETLEVQLVVPSRWLMRLKPGVPFRFSVDETGEEVKGRIVRLGAAVDPVSQTIRVTGVFEGDPRRVLPGMSGDARFDGFDTAS